MAVVISKDNSGQPLAGNPILFKATTDNMVLTDGNKLRYQFSFFGGTSPGVGEVFTIEFDNNYLELSAVASSPGADQFTAKDAGTSYPDWANNFVAEMKADARLSSYFNITVQSSTASGAVILFEFKESGFTFGFVNWNPGSGILSALQNAVAEVLRPNFNLLLELWAEADYRSDDFNRIASLRHKPDADGVTHFDIAPFMLELCGEDLPQYDLAATELQKANDMQKRFHLRIVEEFGEPPVKQVQWPQDYYEGFAIRGGLPHQAYTYDYDMDIAADGTKRNWLSWMPDNKKVLPDSYDWLYFRYLTTDIAKVRVKRYYKDGTDSTQTRIDSGDFANVEVGDIVIIPAGMINLAVDNVLADDVTKYEVIITDASNNPLYTSMTFVLDREPYKFTRRFLFMNSWGAYEVLTCTGKKTTRVGADKEVARKYLPYDRTGQDYSREKYNVRAEHQFTISTGYLSKQWVQHYEELLLQHGPAYEIIDGKYVPIIIDGRAQELYKEDEGIYTLEFSYRYAYQEDWYYRRDVLGEVLADDGNSSSS